LALSQINRTNVVEEIVDRLMSYVAELQPGDRIPPERALVQKLGVSRSSMREALRVLSSLGLLEVREGLGTFVAQNDGPFLTQALVVSSIVGGQTAREMHEVRALIEPHAARLAAERATPEHIEEIGRCLREQEASLDSVDRFLEADVAFHLAIAQAAENRVLFQMLRAVRALLVARMATTLSTRRDMVPRHAEHRAVYEAIARRDPDAAERAMREHMKVFSPIFRAD
jgi:GntR family transcriptional repressor for pyruvate dehydrogenase complex